MSRAGLGGRRIDVHARMRNKRKPPRGMFLNQECLMVMAAGPSGHEDTALKQHKADLVELKRQVRLSFIFGIISLSITIYGYGGFFVYIS